MVRHWCVPLAALALMAGTAVAAGAASAAPALAQSTPAVVSPGHPMAGAGSSVSRSATANGLFSPAAQSTNWSGYATHTGIYHSVSATWVVPKPVCTSGAGKKYAAFWVGLDGYNSNSVEQTGTDSDCNSATHKYYGWYEMFPANPVFFSNIIKPGDTISASVTFSGTNTYKLVLEDKTRHWTKTITKHESGLTRTSAEVITEAPSSSSGVLPLADFGKITYSSARVNGKLLKNEGPTKIVMINGSGQDKATTSTFFGASSDVFRNVWDRSS
jgi:hypothetical protein